MLIIICISLVGLIIMLIELRRAPEAHENRSGFHLLPHKPSRDRMAGLEQSDQNPRSDRIARHDAAQSEIDGRSVENDRITLEECRDITGIEAGSRLAGVGIP